MTVRRRTILAATLFVAGLVAPLVPTNPAGATTYIVPSSIASGASCSSSLPDVTNALNNWLLNTVPNNATAQLGASRCYHTEGTVLFAVKSGVTFDGNGSTLKSYNDATQPRDHPHLTVRNNTNSTVENLNVVGAKPPTAGYNSNLEAQHGISILGNNGLTVAYDTVDWVWGDFVFLQTYNGHVPTTISINSDTFGGAAGSGEFSAGRQEISIDDGSGVQVVASYFGHGARSAVDIEPNSTGATLNSILFYGNQFGPQHLTWFANHGVNATITSVWFILNTVAGTMSVDSVVPDVDMALVNPADPSTYKRSDYVFDNNTSQSANATGDCSSGGGDTIRLWAVNGVQIDANTQPMVAGRCQYFVLGRKIIGASVQNNTLLNAVKVGDYDVLSSVCESGNQIGNPLHAAPLSANATSC